MAAYVDLTANEFLGADASELSSTLHASYAADGFVSQYTSQTIAWDESIPLIKEALADVIGSFPLAGNWRVIIEMPLYRLRRRIDLVVLCPEAVAVVELKVGETEFHSTDFHQVEEYALDLRDFHEPSHGVPIIPVLWCTEAPNSILYSQKIESGVLDVVRVGKDGLGPFLISLAQSVSSFPSVIRDDWTDGVYKPVPSVIEAATSLFAGHGVTEIAQADAANLDLAASRISDLIQKAQQCRERYLIFLTGVPGSGKTLAGLQVVHNAKESNLNSNGDVVYLSGNTPLVTVLREALTEDEYKRCKADSGRAKKVEIRSAVRSRIQHIMDFLREYISDTEERPPHEHAIVFDEAQRAWDADYGKKKFKRSASEPRLLLDIMGRHNDWSVIVGLIGGGQEINTGENGMVEWGEALRSLSTKAKCSWKVFGPPQMLHGSQASAFLGLGDLAGFDVSEDPSLELEVPLRSFRSPLVAKWVTAVLDGKSSVASSIMSQIHEFPIVLTRDSSVAKDWLKTNGRGERRFGMVASSTASRLRAEGFGVSISAADGANISNWYLAPRTDVRSSYHLEVLANEYTTQGLELDFIGLCWGGDLLWTGENWETRKFAGSKWQAANGDRRRFIINSYRVLLTRAREGVVIWVPRGSLEDPTRTPRDFDKIAAYLQECGVRRI